MRSVTDARGLGDLRTAITSRIHAKPPRKGTAHLDLYLLDMERQRLEKELARLERRRERIQGHLAEIAKAMAKLGQEATSEQEPAVPSTEHSYRQRKTMELGY
jgi:hypothetical protein